MQKWAFLNCPRRWLDSQLIRGLKLCHIRSHIFIFNWRGFLDRSLTDIERHGVTRLILDLRRNEGGDSAIGDALLAHLRATPYTPEVGRAKGSFVRVPDALAYYLHPWDLGFLDHAGQVIG